MSKTEAYLADFDSASAMVRAVASFMRREDFPRLGMDDAISHLIPLANRFPLALRHQVYTWSGWMEAISSEQIEDVEAEALSGWAVRQYDEGSHDAIAIGSSNGALVHLWGPLGAPWLPQTFLVPVRRHMHPDEMQEDLEWGRDPGRRLLDRNPELQLHHMHDPNQDRLMVSEMTYFRVKRRTLGETYRQFIRERLRPGGTIFVVECERRWPVVTVGERHYFQPGAMGGARPDEYHEGSERVADYLERYDSHRRQWPVQEPDGEMPEAEWGFEPALREEILELAARHGYRVRRVVFTEPEDPSPWIAELYRWWYRRRSMPADRLLIESFILMEPWWALRTGTVPYWAKFGTDPSINKIHAYLEAVEPYREIFSYVFPHGIHAVGTAPAPEWRERVLSRATERGEFIGVDEDEAPADFAHLKRYHDELPEKIRARYPVPFGLSLTELDEWLATDASGRWDIRIEDAEVPAMAGGGGR
jgi:hypothetical protein